MDIKPIKTESDYQAALREIEGLMDAQPDTLEGDRLDIMTTLIEAYEARHYPIDPPVLTETPERSYQLTQYEPEFEIQMKLIEEGMARYRNTFYSLAK